MLVDLFRGQEENAAQVAQACVAVSYLEPV